MYEVLGSYVLASGRRRAYVQIHERGRVSENGKGTNFCSKKKKKNLMVEG